MDIWVGIVVVNDGFGSCVKFEIRLVVQGLAGVNVSYLFKFMLLLFLEFRYRYLCDQFQCVLKVIGLEVLMVKAQAFQVGFCKGIGEGDCVFCSVVGCFVLAVENNFWLVFDQGVFVLGLLFGGLYIQVVGFLFFFQCSGVGELVVYCGLLYSELCSVCFIVLYIF